MRKLKLKDFLPGLVGTTIGSIINWFIYKDIEVVIVGVIGAFLALGILHLFESRNEL